MLEAVCSALGVLLSDVLFEVAHTLVRREAVAAGVPVGFLPSAVTPAAAPAAPVIETPPVVVEPVGAGVLDFSAFAARRTA